MHFRIVGFMLFYLKFEFITIQVSSLPLGCWYNGTSFQEGDGIITEEPCLSCVCRRGSLVCNLRVCADPPDSPPPGCFVVRRPESCCPELLCEDGFVQNDVELRTSSKTENTTLENGCFINGSVYAEGSALASSQECEYCYCIQGVMKCIKPKCYQPFEGCKPIYRDSSCCPTHYDCRDLVTSVSTVQKDYGCERNGTYYEDGAFVPHENGSACESCYCMKSKIECAPVVCSMDSFSDCQPILAPYQCCPTSFTCGKNSTSDSNRSFVTETLDNEEVVGVNNNSTEALESRMDEGTTEGDDVQTTTETTTAEISTFAAETETTTSVVLWRAEINVADNSTFLSLQASSQNNTTEAPASFTEETTLEIGETSPPTPLVTGIKKDIYDVEVETKLDFTDQRAASGSLLDFDDSHRNVSSPLDDYDSYDYSEPKLPPSLPNLVIFPFVAADAVVKEESTTESQVYNPANIKRIDTQSVFFKEYFSPPAHTEGGFVPKDSSESFYENSYYNKLSGGSETVPAIKPDECYSKGRIFQHGEITSEPGNCVACTCLRGLIVCEDVECPPASSRCKRNSLDESCCGTLICEPNAEVTEIEAPEVKSKDPLNEVTEVSLISKPAPFHLTPQTSKPVTVTYKNIVVDYYPDFQITSARTTIKNKNGESFLEPETISVVTPPQVLLSGGSKPVPSPDASDAKPPTAIIKPVPTKKPTPITTTSESSFFDELFKSFLSEETETPRPSKHKYSSRIKAGEDKTNSTTSSYSFLDLLLNTDLGTTTNKTIPYKKIIKKEEVMKNSLESGSREPPPFSESVEDNKKPNNKVEESHQRHSNLELFKLAGCNIYGRMYRVGKIIIELSGPCLECVCTNLGVQCKSLTC